MPTPRILTALLALTLPTVCLAAQSSKISQRQSVPPSAFPLDYESPPAAPPAQVASCTCDERPGPESIYLHSGEFHTSHEDMRIPGRGIDFVWARKYRSRLGPNSSIGNGWDFSYNLSVRRSGLNVVLHDGNTREDTYRKRTGNLYEAAEQFREGMFMADGESFLLTFADHSTWSFRPLNSSMAPGMIDAITDRHGNALRFQYDALGRLSTIRDTLSRDIVVSYGADGMIAAVTDFIGRKFAYEYYSDSDAGGSSGDLKSATTPAVTGEAFDAGYPTGKTTVYTYTKGFTDDRLNHNLETVTDPKGQTWLLNEYSPTTDSGDPEFDRLVSQERGANGSVEHYAIPAGGLFVIVNDRVGNVCEYEFDGNDRCVRVRQYTGRAQRDQPTTDTSNRPQGKLRPSDPDWFETRYLYNPDARRTRTIHPNGNVTRRVFEGTADPTGPARTRGNLRELHRLPGGHKPVGDQSMLHEMFEWQPGLGACCGEEFVKRHVDPRGNVTTHSYDAVGNRTQTIHRLPSIIEDFQYNGFGQLTGHTHPDNGGGLRRQDSFLYYGAGTPVEGYLMSQIVDVAQHALTTTWEYDLVGNVTKVVDPRGNDKLFTVNELNQVVREQSPLVTLFGGGGPIRYNRWLTYDANDNLSGTYVDNLDEQGMWVFGLSPVTRSRYFYDSLNFLVREDREYQDDVYASTTYERDRNENLVLKRFGQAVAGLQPANTVTLRYDERDLLFQLVKAEGDPAQSTEQRDYDGNGNLVRRLEGLEGQPRITRFTYDAYNRRRVTRDAMGNRELIGYDPNGNTDSRQVSGELVDVPGKAGNARLLQEVGVFDPMDRCVQSVVKHFDPLTQQPIGDGQSIQGLSWTDSSNVHMTVDDNGNTTTFAYDTAHRLKDLTDAKGNRRTFNYDNNSNVVAVVEFELSDTGQPGQTFVTDRVFDEVNRVVEERDNADNLTLFGYDSRDNLTYRVDALGNVVQTSYDGLSRRNWQWHFLTDDGTGGGQQIGVIHTVYEWDWSSRLFQRTDSHVNFERYVYDPLNRLIAQTHTDGTTHAFSYDVHGNRVGRVDANGTTVTTTFDLLNRPTSTSVAPGPGVSSDTTFESFAYDGLSRLVRAQDDDSTVLRRHDSLSNLVAETQNGRTLTAVFDGEGNRRSCTYPGGRAFTSSFDELNRMDSISDTQVLATWDFFGPGRVERRTQPPVSLTSHFTHDLVKRIVSTDHSDAGPVDQRQYQWDEVYNKVGMTDVRAGGPSLSHTFTYDSAYRMLRALVLNAIGPTRDTNYVFDDVNNRESVTGDPNCSGSYVLDPTLPSPGDFQANQYTSTPCDSRTHDENGNLIGTFVAGGSSLMTYDFKNRMVSYGNDATYSYDPLGRRIGKSVVDETGVAVVTEYLYDEWRVCEERDDTDGVRRTFVYGLGIDEVLNMRSTDRDIYFVGDEQGSITAALEPGNGVVCRYTYGDYGQPSFFDGAGNPLAASATDNPYLFTGRRFDVESGLYNYRTRYLDPTVGRFTTRDTIGIWGDENNLGNGFAYVGNNPQSFVDPMGEDAYQDAVWWAYRKQVESGAGTHGAKFWAKVMVALIYINKWHKGYEWDNPDPNGGASGLASDFTDLLEKLLKIGGKWEYTLAANKTPLWASLVGNKGTALPWVNPVPEDMGRQHEGEGGGGFGYNAGSIREQMERKKRQGRGKSDDDDDGDGGKPPGDARVGYYWDIGPSDLVNPHDHALLQLAVPVKQSVSD